MSSLVAIVVVDDEAPVVAAIVVVAFVVAVIVVALNSIVLFVPVVLFFPAFFLVDFVCFIGLVFGLAFLFVHPGGPVFETLAGGSGKVLGYCHSGSLGAQTLGRGNRRALVLQHLF